MLFFVGQVVIFGVFAGSTPSGRNHPPVGRCCRAALISIPVLNRLAMRNHAWTQRDSPGLTCAVISIFQLIALVAP